MMAPGPLELLIISAILLVLIGIPIAVVVALFVISRSQKSQPPNTQGGEYREPPDETK